MVGVTDNVGRLVTVVGLVVGVPAGLAVLELGWWAVAVAVGAAAILTLGEGAYRVSNRVQEELERMQTAGADARTVPPWLRENLARRMTLGQMLFVEIDRADGFDALLAQEGEVHKWEAATVKPLRDHRYELAALFQSDTGLPERYDDIGFVGYDFEGHRENIKRRLHRRMLRLEQVMEKLD